MARDPLDCQEVAVSLRHAARLAADALERLEEVEACVFAVVDASANLSALADLAVLARAGARLARYAGTDLKDAAERFSLEADRYEEAAQHAAVTSDNSGDQHA